MATVAMQLSDIPELFHDVTPVPQNEGPNPVCVIAYPSAFSMAFGYMRAMWQTKELSDRSLKLTAVCLQLNPANYTVWHFRRQCLEALGMQQDPKAIQQDLDLAASLGGDNPKNYQLWYHRRAMLEVCPSFQDFVEGELEYISDVLDEDGKNYHAWSHRQWVVSTANDESIWEKELDFAKELIEEDPRNNSAWNQRWFASHRSKKECLSAEIGVQEADFAIEVGAKLDPFNESPWRYLIGILKEQWRSNNNKQLLEEYEHKTVTLREVVSEAQRDPDACTNLTSAHVDILEMKGDKESLTGAISLCQGLADKHDQIRSKYWKLRIQEMEIKREQL